MDNEQLDLARYEADIAIRAARPHEGDLFGRKLAEIAWTFYERTAPERKQAADYQDILFEKAFIGWHKSANTKTAHWLAKMMPENSAV